MNSVSISWSSFFLDSACQVAVQAVKTSHIDNISLSNLNGGDHEAGCTLVGSTSGK